MTLGDARSSQDRCGALAYNDAWRHGVANCHPTHDQAIRNAKIFDSVDFKVAIDYRHIVSTHLCCTCFVPEARSCIANKVFKLSPFKFPGITSRLTNGRSAAEFPISRQSSTPLLVVALHFL